MAMWGRRTCSAVLLAFCCLFFADSASWAVSNGEVPPLDASPSASSSSEPSASPVEPQPAPSSPEPSPSPLSASSPSPSGELQAEPFAVSESSGDPTSTVVVLDETSHAYDIAVALLLGNGLLVALVAALLFVQIGTRD